LQDVAGRLERLNIFIERKTDIKRQNGGHTMINITIDSKIRVTGLPESLSLAAVRDCTMKNPEYVTRQRLGKWLGGIEPTITLAGYAEDALILPRGYLGRLIARIYNAGFEYHIEDRRLLLPEIDITFRGKLRPYQARALTSMAAHGSGILVAPCGSGKTALLAALIAHCRRPSLVLVHTRQLAEQTREAMKRWLDVAPGLIGDGVFDVQPVTVGIVQSLAGNAERVEAVRNRFGLIALDEAHHSPAATFTDVLQQFPADFRYGVTATPDRRDRLSPFMELVIGPVRHTVTSEELRDAGVLVTPEIVWQRTGFQHYGDDWVELISALTKDAHRNDFLLGVMNELIDDGRRIIALSERVNHVEALADCQ
jgi:superfamily II DNA or RNA helicase